MRESERDAKRKRNAECRERDLSSDSGGGVSGVPAAEMDPAFYNECREGVECQGEKSARESER